MALVQQSYGVGTTLVQHTSTTTTTTMNTIPGGGSRLAQMQARFQQRQLQEKEQKLLRMFESQQQKTIERVGRGSAGSSGSSGSSSSSGSTLGAGKVRQLFDERRGGAAAARQPGWDRSYPLEPLGRPAAAAAARPGNGHAKATRGASLDRTFTVLASTGYRVPPAGKVPVRRSKSQARHDDADNANNNQEVDETRHNGHSYYQSFRTLPPEEVHVEESRDDNSNQLFTSEINHVEDMLSKHTLLDNEEPPEIELVEEEDEPERQQEGTKVEDEPDTPEVISKLPNVGGPLRAPEEAPAKLGRDRYKTYNANNGHPGQEKRRPRVEPEPRRTRDLDTKKSREITRQAQETKRTRETTSRPQVDTAKSPSNTQQIKSATSSRPSKAGSSSQPRSPVSPTTSQPAAATKKRTSTPVGRSSELATSRAAPSRAAPSRQPVAGATAATSTPQDDLVACRVCSRRFAADRIQQHEQICNRTSKKTRKVFDPIKHRVQGTEAEAYIRKIKAQPQKVTNTKKLDWRKKHEDFIATIRAAKQAQAHIAAGGKVSDLPPPPPSDYSDYVQCPHCSRRFNDQAAARHIPKCANMLHNKPKPVARGAPPRRR